MAAMTTVLMAAAAELKLRETLEGVWLRQLLAGEPAEVSA
jgi:hypothetical protein